MWTIRINAAAHELLNAMLQTIPETYPVRVEHAEFNGRADFVGVTGQGITVRPDNHGDPGEPVELDWDGLDAVEVE